MSDAPLLSRRAFTVESVLAILATATITITGCDEGSDLGPSPPAGARDRARTDSCAARRRVVDLDGAPEPEHGIELDR